MYYLLNFNVDFFIIHADNLELTKYYFVFIIKEVLSVFVKDILKVSEVESVFSASNNEDIK